MRSTNTEPPQDATALLRPTFRFVSSQILYLAADLGIADKLARGALSARELASNSRQYLFSISGGFP
jgi:hypothetical protein